MKTLLLTLQATEKDDPETYVLEGDRRQSSQRMIERGLEKLIDESVEFVDEDKRKYRSRESGNLFEIQEARLLDESEAAEKKREHFTLVINENVTEGSCRVRYS